MKAKEMFKELGFKRAEDDRSIRYFTANNMNFITFWKDKQKTSVSHYRNIKYSDTLVFEEVQTVSQEINEIAATIKQMEELGWTK